MGEWPLYIGGQQISVPLDWWSLGNCSLTFQQKSVPLDWWPLGRCPFTLMVNGRVSLYIGGQWRSVLLNWWLESLTLRSVRNYLPRLVANVGSSYIVDQWRSTPLDWWLVEKNSLTLMVSVDVPLKFVLSEELPIYIDG